MLSHFFLHVVVGFLEVLLNQAQKYNVREHMTLPTINIILGWLAGKEGYLSNGNVKTHRYGDIYLYKFLVIFITEYIKYIKNMNIIKISY